MEADGEDDDMEAADGDDTVAVGGGDTRKGHRGIGHRNDGAEDSLGNGGCDGGRDCRNGRDRGGCGVDYASETRGGVGEATESRSDCGHGCGDGVVEILLYHRRVGRMTTFCNELEFRINRTTRPVSWSLKPDTIWRGFAVELS